MKKILISILILGGLIGIGYSVWHLCGATRVGDEETITPSIGNFAEQKLLKY